MEKTRHAPLVTQPEIGMKAKDWDSKDKRWYRRKDKQDSKG